MRYRIILVFMAILTLCGVGVRPASALTADEQTKLTSIINKGDQEIERRLTSLNAAAKVIDLTQKLSTDDKQTLKDEITSTISGLTTLKTKLDATTTLVDARTTAKAIISDYRVYALVLPKVRLVKVADGQIALEAKFIKLSSMLVQRLAELKTAGQETGALEVALANMNTKVSAAQAISTSIQAKVIALQPSDYNNDHTVLSGNRDQLKTAHDELVAARTYAASIIDDIKALTNS